MGEIFKHLQAWWWLLTRKPCFDAAKFFLNFLKMRTIEFAEKFGSSQKGKCLKFHFFEIRRIVITRKWRQWNRLLERVSKSYLHMRPHLRFVQLWFPMWDRILLKLVLMPAEATVLSTKELWYRTKMWAWQFKKHRFYISTFRRVAQYGARLRDPKRRTYEKKWPAQTIKHVFSWLAFIFSRR